MAKDVITRFKLETTSFDSKIKEAAKELSAYSKTATQAKEGFNQFTKANVDAAKALGTMATSSTNVKDRAKELVGAFNDAAKAYNSLTKEQQQSDWAKALAGSLTQLQQRIKETKQEMQGLGDSMKGGGGGIFSGMDGKMSGALQVFAGNMLTKAAGAVANLGSEMTDMVQQGIELARQGEGIRIAFERLGRGDILDGLREATHGTVTDIELMKAAVKFNDFKLPLNELGTMLAFAQQKAKDTGQSVDYMVDSIVTGLGRQSLLILDNLGLSASDIKEHMKETGDMTTAVGAIIREQMAKAGDYVETAADRAAQANVSLQNKMEELGRKFAPVEEASNQLWTSMKIGILDVVGGPLARLLNGLTEAGRMRNALNNINAMGGEGQTLAGKHLGTLRQYATSHSTADVESLAKRQVARYAELEAQEWKKYNQQKSKLNQLRSEYGSGWGVGGGLEKDMEASRNRAMAWRQVSAEYQAGAKQIVSPFKNPPPFPNPTSTPTTPTPTAKEQTELQKNQKTIADLTEEYQRLADVSKSATGQTLSAATERMTAIKTEIKALQDRNDELKKWADEAAGKTTGLIEEQTKKAARLNEELTHATTVADIQRINKELEATNDRLTILRGKLPENKTAEFKVEVDAKQLAELQDKLPKGATITERVNVEQGEVKLPSVPTDDKTIRVNVEQGDVDIPDVPTNDKTIKVNVEQGDVDMPDVPTDDKTIRVNVEQGEVNLPSVPTDDKTIKVNVEQGDVDMPDVPTDVKQLVTVTADTAEAAQAIVALVDGNYSVTISAKMNMEEGFAGLSDNALTAYIAGLKKDLSGAEIGSDFYNKIAQNMGDATALQNVIKTAVAAGFDLSGFDFEMPWEQILSFDDADDALTSLIEQINEKLKEIGRDPIKINLQTGGLDNAKDLEKDSKNMADSWRSAGSAIQAVGSALNSIENPAAKVAGTIAQAIASIALSFATSLKGSPTPWDWIAAAAAGTATMIATISAVKSATKGGFADGGIVPGNSFSGDLLRTSDYGINSGELVLTRAQTNSLAAQLTDMSMPEQRNSYISGEQIVTVVNAYGRRSGRGEILK